MNTTSLLQNLGRRQKMPAAIRLLREFSLQKACEWWKTHVFTRCTQRPRQLLHALLFDFYRQDHIYDVLREFISSYRGEFSILVFDAAGQALAGTLDATRHLGCENRITVHGFHFLAGPSSNFGRCGESPRADNSQYQDYESLAGYCARRYRNFVLHRGMFDRTMTPELFQDLRKAPPIFLWFDRAYRGSTAGNILDRLIPALPTGCVVFFDGPFDRFGNGRPDEAQLIQEINAGLGQGARLVVDRALSVDSEHIYRLMNLNVPTT